MPQLWEEKTDVSSGAIYYQNTVTLQSQWKKPSEVDNIKDENTLALWLKQVGLASAEANIYAHSLVADGFDCATTLRMCEVSDLKDLGVKTGHAKLIVRSLEADTQDRTEEILARTKEDTRNKLHTSASPQQESPVTPAGDSSGQEMQDTNCNGSNPAQTPESAQKKLDLATDVAAEETIGHINEGLSQRDQQLLQLSKQADTVKRHRSSSVAQEKKHILQQEQRQHQASSRDLRRALLQDPGDEVMVGGDEVVDLFSWLLLLVYLI
jgi:hypothetical protein